MIRTYETPSLLQPITDLGHIDSHRLLVFGGPYSNLAATEAMFAQAGELGIEAHHSICTGDIVAYCAEPEAVCRVIRDCGMHVIMGNCEESLAFDADDCGCGFDEGMTCSALSERWYRFAREQVSSSSRQWMAGLPRILKFELADVRFAVVHGAADSINRFVFASSSAAEKSAQLALLDVDVVIGGHCGLPFGQQLDNGYWLNAGVIGMPANDGQAGGWYMLLEGLGNAVEARWHRLDYPAQASYDAMLAADLPDYAPALNSGLWPSLDVLPDVEKQRAGQAIELAPLLIAPNQRGHAD